MRLNDKAPVVCPSSFIPHPSSFKGQRTKDKDRKLCYSYLSKEIHRLFCFCYIRSKPMRYEDRDETSVTTKLTYLLIGGGIGAVIALLFAPKSGVELREDIADATRKGLEKGRETAAQIQERAGEYYEVGRERASELYSTAQEKAGELGEK